MQRQWADLVAISHLEARRLAYMTDETNSSRCTPPVTDKRLREIAVLEVELAMTEAHAEKLANTVSNLADRNLQDAMTVLLKEESDRAATLKRQLKLLRDQT